MPDLFAELKLTPRALAWLAVAGLVASLTALGSKGLGLWATLLIAMASAVLQTAVLGAGLAFAGKLLLRFPLLLAPTLMLSGATRGFFLSWVAFGETTAALAQAANASVTNLVWGSVALILISQREKFELAYRQHAAQLFIGPGNFKVRSQPEIAQLTRRVREIVQAMGANDSPRREPLEALSRDIRLILAPLQRRLLVGKSLSPEISLRRIIWSAIKSPNPSPTFVVVTWATLNLGGAFTIFGTLRATLSLVLASLLVWVLLRLAGNVAAGLPRFSMTFVAILMPTFITDFAMTVLGFASGLSELEVFPFSVLACLALVVFSSCINLVQADREHVLAKLRALTSPSADYEDYVHSAVQGALLTLVSKFLGIRNPTDRDVQALVAELKAFLSRDFDEEFSSAAVQPELRLETLKNNWSSLLDVWVAGDFLGSASALVKQQALMVLDEGIRNASRHAGATWVRAESQQVSRDRLQIVISSDRHNTSTKRHHGGGMRMLDKICLSWRLDLSPKTSKLTADLLVF